MNCKILKSLVFLLWVIPVLSQAQLIKSFAVRAGGSIATQDWKFKMLNVSQQNARNITGVFGGFDVEFLRGKVLGLTADFSYCQKGYSRDVMVTTAEKPDGDGTFLRIEDRFNYFSFSPLMNIHHDNEHWSTYAGIGPRVDFFISRTVNGQKASGQEFKTSILGATALGGIGYKIGNMSIFGEARFLYDAGYAINNEFVEVKNMAAVLCIGFRQRIAR